MYYDLSEIDYIHYDVTRKRWNRKATGPTDFAVSAAVAAAVAAAAPPPPPPPPLNELKKTFGEEVLKQICLIPVKLIYGGVYK